MEGHPIVIATQTPTTERPIKRQMRRWRFDVSDYVRLHESGIIPEEARTELVQGEIRIMAPIGPEHGSSVNTLSHHFVRHIGPRAFVSSQSSLRLDDRTMLQPDIAILRPEPNDYYDRYPEAADALLVVEVAFSSLRYDRGRKVPLYARHGIPEVWIVAINERRLEVYRAPAGDSYASVVVLTEGDGVAPLARPDVVLDVGAIVRARG
ncbi:MAG: Uma2 family endonuclease [Ardenticatenales bacterium]|nr:Uma2 family endonuclease [Ardenticatenales bacterium]